MLINKFNHLIKPNLLFNFVLFIQGYMAKKTQKENNLNTEEKFKEAARVVFTRKGYAATKTRDIALEAGLNLALLNYYFRSKEKLFEIIMLEKITQLFAFIGPTVNDPHTSLEEKIDRIADKYIDMLLENQDLPLFVLSEMRNNPERFGQHIQVDAIMTKSIFIKQLAEHNPNTHPIQLLITFLGMLVFPFIAKPVLQASGAVNESVFGQMMNERKQLVKNWMKLLISS